MDILKGLSTAADVLRKADKIPEYQQILDAQEAILNYQKRIGELEGEIKKLKDISTFKETADFHNNCYWLKKEGGQTAGPFCSKCVESDNRIMHLHVRSDGFATCPDCKNHVWSKGEVYFTQSSNDFSEDFR
jgi:hypothetical protein